MYGHKFELRFKRSYTTVEQNDMDQDQQMENYQYDILVDGKKVGQATQDDWMGFGHATMWGRYMPDLVHYNSYAISLADHFIAFIKNQKSGKKWLRVSLKDIPA